MELSTKRPKPLSDLGRWARAHAPGRINLIGEHTDYNGGKVLPFATPFGLELNLAASADLVPRDEATYEIASTGHDGMLVVHGQTLRRLLAVFEAAPTRSTDLRGALPPPVAASWARYAVGVLLWHWHTGLEAGWADRMPRLTRVQIQSTLPIGAGISSSAALCTGLLALLARSESLPEDRQGWARQAMYVEHQFAGTRCGLMDQTAVALCEKGSLLLIDFKDLAARDLLATRTVRPHARYRPYRPVLINTMVKHELGSSPYNERRASCETGLARLRQATGLAHPSFGHFVQDRGFLEEFVPDGRQETLVASLAARVFQGETLLARRVAHAIMEVVRVDQAVAALEGGDLTALAAAIQGSHASLRDDYEVSCRELDLVCAQALAVAERLGTERGLAEPPILGARMTGGGFGGSTIQLVHEGVLASFVEAMRAADSAYVQATGLTPQVVVTELSAGLLLESSTPEVV